MKKKLGKGLIWLFWIAVWFLLAFAVGNKIILAGPVETVKAFVTMLGKESFYMTVAGSLLRIGAGFLLGFSAAVLLAAVSSRFMWVEELFNPFMNLIKTIPVASFVVLLLIWWGASFLAVAICFLVVLPNIYISTLEGLKNADVRLLEMAQVFRLSRWNCFFYIYRPALKPFLFSSLKISLGMCWKSGVAAEVIGTPDYSIGERLYLSKVYLDTADLFAWTAVIILLSMLFEMLVLRLAESFFAWEPVCKGGDLFHPTKYLDKKKSIDKKKNIPQEAGNIHENSVNDNLPCVQLKNVVKSFDGQPVIDSFSTDYLAGQVYYLTSPSGSGKTTLLRILAGLTKADEGEILVPKTCSMVFQEDRLCEDYSAVKNVELAMGDSKRAAQALKKLLDEEAIHKPCKALSGGMKRRVALVRAMETESEFVLLDEPFTGMDADTKHRAEAYIRESQRGRTLIIATHI